MSAIRTRQQHNPQTAVSAAGQEEPVEPAYWKPTAASPIASNMKTPSKPTEWKAPVVLRGQRRNGMRYQYARGAVRQPISPIGTPGPDLGQAVWISDFQPDFMGPIRDWGFNDQLFQAGYPGFNLGLSFKVQQLQTQATGGPGYAMKMRYPNIRNRIVRLNRSAGTPNTSG